MIANYKEHGFEIRARILPEACTACPFYLYSVSCDDAVCYLTGSGIPIDGPQDEGRAPDCPIKALEGFGEWIPCSERPPKRQGYYNCTCKDGSKYKRTTVVKWSNGWQLTGARAYWVVLAWMPLPDPWKGANDEATT